ncbi:MAG: hypothetical protein U0236_23515, partial [Nitrospira sp.]
NERRDGPSSGPLISGRNRAGPVHIPGPLGARPPRSWPPRYRPRATLFSAPPGTLLHRDTA